MYTNQLFYFFFCIVLQLVDTRCSNYKLVNFKSNFKFFIAVSFYISSNNFLVNNFVNEWKENAVIVLDHHSKDLEKEGGSIELYERMNLLYTINEELGKNQKQLMEIIHCLLRRSRIKLINFFTKRCIQENWIGKWSEKIVIAFNTFCYYEQLWTFIITNYKSLCCIYGYANQI